MGRPPTYDHDTLLHEIIDCLWERGYAATPVSTIVQETGVNAASLYARFGSKKGLMLAALEMYAKETLEGLEALLASEQPGVPQVRAILEHAMQSFSDPQRRGCFLVNSIANISTEMPEFATAVSGHMERIRVLIRNALAEAPGLRVSPEDAALFVQVQVWGIKLLARMEPAEDMGRIVIRQTLNALFTDEAVAAAS